MSESIQLNLGLRDDVFLAYPYLSDHFANKRNIPLNDAADNYPSVTHQYGLSVRRTPSSGPDRLGAVDVQGASCRCLFPTRISCWTVGSEKALPMIRGPRQHRRAKPVWNRNYKCALPALVSRPTGSSYTMAILPTDIERR